MLKLRDWIDIDKIEWKTLSLNPNAIELLKENQNKIDWFNLSRNPNAIKLLKENQYKICLRSLSKNPNIFNYDYKQMKENIKKSGIAEELMAFIFHPKNMDKWINWGFIEHNDFMDFIDK